MTKREKEDAKVFAFVERTLKCYSEKYQLRLKKVSRTRPSNSFFGWCKPGEIAMTIRWKNGRQIHSYAIVDTMAHELAHLRHQSHSQRWALFYAKLFHEMVAEGVYAKARKIVKRKP